MDSDEDDAGPCPDLRFVGDWTYTLYWVASDGINEKNEYESYEFENSDEGFYYKSIENYSKSSGWRIEQTDYLFKWTVSGNQLLIMIDGSDTWLTPLDYEFNGESLFINSKEFKK